MPDLRLVLSGSQQEPVAPLVQYGRMWFGREGATLLPEIESALWLLTRVAALNLKVKLISVEGRSSKLTQRVVLKALTRLH